MSAIGKRLIAAAREASAIARGEAKPHRAYVPADVDVRAIRQRLKLSQEEFASEFGFTTNQIRDWEQGRSRPTGAARAYMVIIHSEPDTVRALLKKATRSRTKAAA